MNGTRQTSGVHELRDGVITVYEVDPTDFGIPRATRSALAGGDAAGNADVVHKIFAGASGPIRDIVALNSAAALMVADLAPDLGAGVKLAGEILDDDARWPRSMRWCVSPSPPASPVTPDGEGARVSSLRAKHRLDGLEPSTTFRCEQCGRDAEGSRVDRWRAQAQRRSDLSREVERDIDGAATATSRRAAHLRRDVVGVSDDRHVDRGRQRRHPAVGGAVRTKA